MPVASTNGINTFYLDERPSGAARGAVVLVHGHGADHRVWQYQSPALIEADYRVLRYDVRGHGQSSVPADGYVWEEYSRDLIGLLDHAGIERAHVGGSSMGGGIALQFALDAPERVESLALVDSALPGFTYSEEFTSQIEELVEAVRSEGARAAFERLWLQHPFFDGVRRFPERFEMLREIVLSYQAADYAEGAVPERYEPSITDRLGEIEARALVVVGENDVPDFQLVAEVLASNLPKARLLRMEGCWHLPMLEEPERFSRALVGFVGEG